jgi:uncharacterized protein YoxC
MEQVIQIAILLALIAFFVLCIYAIIALRKVGGQIDIANKSLKSASDSITQVSNKALIALDEIVDLKKKFVYSLDHIDQVSEEMKMMSSKGVENLERITLIFQPIEMLINSAVYKLSPPITNVVNIISAAGKAFGVFTDKILKKKN